MASESSPKGVVDLISQVREASNLFIAKALKERGLEGIVPAHGQILFPLLNQGIGGTMALNEIVRASGRAKSTITGMVDTLEKNGYLNRISCQVDKRSVRVELTDKGRALEQSFRDISRELVTALYGEIPAEKQDMLMEILEKIKKNLTQATNN